MNRLRERFEYAINDDRLRDDRGDVPGWVLITLMTAALATYCNIEV